MILLFQYLDFTLFTKEAIKFFRELVLGNMRNREENNIIRPDMIHLLMEAKKGKNILKKIGSFRPLGQCSDG